MLRHGAIVVPAPPDGVSTRRYNARRRSRSWHSSTTPPRRPTTARAISRARSATCGKIVGFIDNAKPNFHFLVDDLAELLIANHGVKAVMKRAKRGSSMPAPEACVAELAKECDLVITGSGD